MRGTIGLLAAAVMALAGGGYGHRGGAATTAVGAPYLLWLLVRGPATTA